VAIDGLIVTPLRQINDARGAVLHMLRSDAPEFTQFGECYFSEVMPGIVKGWKRHRKQTQHLAVPVGRIRFVAFDGNVVQVIELGRPDAYVRLTVPPGIWYSFGCIGDSPALLANCADMPHDPGESEQKPLDDASIPYHWEKV
jgi:dTDP-4-dehydrorhamnose 3,5-epimerase